MGHDDSTHETGGKTPGGGPDILEQVILVQILDFEGFSEVLTQVMGSAGLQGLGITHHGFDADRSYQHRRTFQTGSCAP